jgi:hypothetical protein
VIMFDNLSDDSSPDIREAWPAKKVVDVHPSPLPFMLSELPCCAFVNFLEVLMFVFYR